MAPASAAGTGLRPLKARVPWVCTVLVLVLAVVLVPLAASTHPMRTTPMRSALPGHRICPVSEERPLRLRGGRAGDDKTDTNAFGGLMDEVGEGEGEEDDAADDVRSQPPFVPAPPFSSTPAQLFCSAETPRSTPEPSYDFPGFRFPILFALTLRVLCLGRRRPRPPRG